MSTQLARAIDAHRHGHVAAAIDGYQRVLRREPRNFDALRLLGVAFVASGHSEPGLAALNRALALRNDSDEVWAVRGDALAQLGRHPQAAASYERALSLRPNYVQVLNRYSVQLDALGRYDDSLKCLRRAAELAADDPTTRYNLGIHHLTSGRLEEGWEGFEWRNRIPPWSHELPSAAPLWDGDADVAGRRLLLTAEQGLGDTIQFCRFATPLARDGARVLLGVPPPLRSLMSSLSGVAQVFTDGGRIPEHDLQIPLLSVPHRRRTSVATIPADVPYLAAAPGRIQSWRERLGTSSRPRIGIACSGNPRHANDRQRSIGLSHFAPLRQLDCELHWLQPDLRDADRPGLHRLDIVDHCDRLSDFGETAALASCLDAVVSVDTAVAHLAGALGLPLFLLLPKQGDWRWMLDRGDSPWYPTARLVRQTHAGDWEAPIQRLRELLHEHLGRPALARAGQGRG